MEIQTGLFDHMVLQMNRQKLSDTSITGQCADPGSVLFKVTKANRTVKGFNWVRVGTAANGKFGSVKNLSHFC